MNRALVAASLMTLGLSGCHSCGESAGPAEAGTTTGSGPSMPMGMLVPTDAPSGAAASASLIRVARHIKGGAWAELQLARPADRADRTNFERWRDDSTFVSLEAMTLLHEAFARALPSFDLFLPRLFAESALTTLASELDAFAARSQGELATAARELASLVRDTAAKHGALWVLGI